MRSLAALLALAALASAETPREVVELRRDANVMSLAVSPDGKLIAAGATDYKVYVIEAETGRTLQVLETRNGHVDAVAFSPDGSRLAAGGNTILFIYDTSAWTLLHTADWGRGPFRTLEFSKDGQRIAGKTFFGKAGVWEAATGRDLVAARGQDGFAAGFAGERTLVASVDAKGRTQVWDKPEGEPILEMEPVRTGELPAGAFSPDGRTFAEWDPKDQKVRIWDLAGDKGPVKRDFPGGETPMGTLGPDLLFVFSPDGKELALEVGHENSGRVVLWNVADGKAIVERDGWVPGFADGGATLVVAGEDSVLRFDAATGKEKPALEGHSRRVRAWALSPDGKFLYAGGDDGKILEHRADAAK